LKASKPVSNLNRKSFLRIADTAALVASCGAAGVVALKLGIVLCGAGLLGLGAAFLVGDVWPVMRNAWHAGPAAVPPDGQG